MRNKKHYLFLEPKNYWIYTLVKPIYSQDPVIYMYAYRACTTKILNKIQTKFIKSLCRYGIKFYRTRLKRKCL
jgi:hypothetical protein